MVRSEKAGFPKFIPKSMTLTKTDTGWVTSSLTILDATKAQPARTRNGFHLDPGQE